MVALRHDGTGRHDPRVLCHRFPLAVLFYVPRKTTRQNLLYGPRAFVRLRDSGQGPTWPWYPVADHRYFSWAETRSRVLEKAISCLRRPSFFDRRGGVVCERPLAGRIGFFCAADYRGKFRHGRRQLRSSPAVLLFPTGFLLEPRTLEFFLATNRFLFISAPPGASGRSSTIPADLAGYSPGFLFCGFGQTRSIHSSALPGFRATLRRVVGD